MEEVASVGKSYILFAEVEFKLHKCCQMQQAVAQLRQLTAEASFQLVECQTVCGTRARCYEVGNGFGATEVHLACKKGAHSELAGLGLTCSVFYEVYKQFACYVGRCVTANLDGVFAGIAVGRTHNG